MDLLVFARVLWRFRLLVAAGIAIAFTLALLSMARVGFEDGSPRIEYRDPEVWSASTTVLLKQRGFPWGSTETTAEGEYPLAIDPSRLTYFALFYSRLANSDAVQREVLLGAGPLIGSMEAAPVTDPVENDPLPFISITGTATSPQTAIQIARRGAKVFSQYVARNQSAAGTAAAQRVDLEVVNAAQGAELVQPRKRTTPLFVFLAVMIAVLGLVFMLENIRPRPVSSAAVVLPTLGSAASAGETADDTTAQAVERHSASGQRRASSG